jgi:uncharacterized protein with PQ loop repeat
MTHDIHGMHHWHRKRNLKRKFKKFINKSIFGIAILSPVMTIPQILKIWYEKTASGVSLLTWSVYLIVAFFWLSYGIFHREKPIIINSVLWIIFDTMVVIGIVLYN